MICNDKVRYLLIYLTFLWISLCAGCHRRPTEVEVITQKLDEALSDPSSSEISEDSSSGSKIEALILANVSYKVIEASDSSYTITICAPDIAQVFDEMYDPARYEDLAPTEYAAASEELLNEIQRKLQKGGFEMTESTLNVPLNNGKLIFTEELVNALYGGLLDKAHELSENYLEDEQK